MRHVIIYHQTDTRNIDTASHDVGADEHSRFARPELLQSSLSILNLAVNDCGGYLKLVKLLPYLISSFIGFNEDYPVVNE